MNGLQADPVVTPRRPSHKPTLIILGLVVLVVGYVSLARLLPGLVNDHLRRVAGDHLSVGHISLRFPLRLVLSDVQLAYHNPGPVLSANRIVATPLWVSWPEKMLWLRRLVIRAPRMQFQRTRAGTLVWPEPRRATNGQVSSRAADTVAPSSSAPDPGWRVSTETIRVSEGHIEFVDQKVTPTFRGTLAHISVEAGRVVVPIEKQHILMAVQADVMGHEQHTAPVYCSGWFDPKQKDLEVSCQLDSLALAAFEPYYSARLQDRLGDARLKVTSQLEARANQLEGRVQLEIDNLTEENLLKLGLPLVDIRMLASGPDRVLTGEVQISGPLDQPGEWQFKLVPGNQIVQRFIQPLVDRGREIIRFRFGRNVIPVGITTATEAVMSNIEAVGRQVEETLRVLAPITPEGGEPQPKMAQPSAEPAGSLLDEPVVADPSTSGSEATTIPASSEADPPASGVSPE